MSVFSFNFIILLNWAFIPWIYFILSDYIAMAASQNPIVSISQGSLKGKWKDKDQVAIFKGIPYAKPPVGDLRWKAPQPVEAWTNLRSAKKHAPIAMQRGTELAIFLGALIEGQGWGRLKTWLVKSLLHIVPKPKESEDCLYLNIRTPKPDSSAKLPVMVWIHGGDHQDGSAIEPFYTGNAIPKEGIVYVTINYRLGLMGYFAHPELKAESPEGVCGNYGTLDQIAALQWVQDNIHAFGGDPNNVTIFGESAGGESVAHMMTSPLAKGLFHKAIMQSPANGGQMIHMSRKFLNYASAEAYGLAFAKIAGVQGEDQLKQLRSMPANKIQKIASDQSQSGSFYPIIDGYVLPKSPFSAFQLGTQNKVPLLIGSNAHEGTLIYPLIPAPLPEYHYADMKEDVLPGFMQKEFGEDLDRLLELYPGLIRREVDEEARFLGHAMFGSKARFYAEQAALNGPAAYYYMFTRVPPSSSQTAGAFHAAELSFVHGTSTPILPLDEKDKVLSAHMIKYWTRFAKTGNPNGEGSPQWSEFDPEYPQWMNLGIADMGMKEVDIEENYQILNRRTRRLVEAMEKLKAKA